MLNKDGGSVSGTELSVDEFRSLVRSSAPICEICGYSDFSLVSHLRIKHNLSAGQYIKRYPTALLSAPIVQELLLRLGQRAITKPILLDDLIEAFQGKVGILGTLNKLASIKSSIGEWFTLDPSFSDLVPPIKAEFSLSSNAPLVALAVLKGKNLLISGPSGTGKTQELLQVLGHLGMPVRRANMHTDVTYSTFIGQMKASPLNGTYFQYGLLPSAMKGGYPVILDEIDFTPPSIGALLHPVLENDGVLYISETQEWIKPKKGFTVLATANTKGKGDSSGAYAGTEVQNTAFLNRFTFKLDAHYLSPDDEAKVVLGYYPSADPYLLAQVIKLANEIRSAHDSGELSVTWTIRNILDFFDLSPIIGSKAALNVTLLNWFDFEDKPLVEGLISRVGGLGI